jgi:transposase-like protein
MKKTKNTRKTHSAEFKARIAMEAVRGLKTVSDIAAENKVHPVQVSQWKKELLESASLLFEKESALKRRDEDEQKQRAKLEQKIGQLTVQVDWLREKSKQLGL